MTRSEFVKAIAEKLGTTIEGANIFLDAFVDAVSESLEKSKDVSITGFSAFSVAKRCS